MTESDIRQGFASSGDAELDRVLGGGYPLPSAVLVEGPLESGKVRLLYSFVKKRSSRDRCAFVTKGTPEEVTRDARAFGVELDQGVYWISGEGGQVHSDLEDLANLSISLKELVRGDQQTTSRVAFDVLSPMLMRNSPEAVYRFLDQLIPEMKKHKGVLLATVEPGMHPLQVLASLEALFDGVVAVEPVVQGNQRSPPRVRVRKMEGLNVGSSPEATLARGERRLAAIMFTDMVGYTALTWKDEATAMEVLEEVRKLVRPLFPKHSGKEIKTIGDAFLIEFVSALEATRCAFDIQQAVHERNAGLPIEKWVQLRVGVHLGDVIHSEDDVYGDAINVASRIEPLAEPGGICVSNEVHEQIQNKFEFPLQSLGKKELKNVGEPLEVFRVVLPWERDEGGGASLDPHRLAVLPFANMSPDPRDEYIADGMTEELIGAVAWMEGVNVVSRTSVMKYKGSQKTATEIGRELGAAYILEGSVRRAGEMVRITVQLIDSANGNHRWVQSWDRRIQDVLGIETDISKRVATSLKLKMAPKKEEPQPPSPASQGSRFCPFCGGEVSPEAAYCGHCGKPLRRNLQSSPTGP